MACFITLGYGQRSITFPAFPNENQSRIEKFEEDETEIKRIETGTSCEVAQHCLLFSMPLPALVYPIPADVNLLGLFLWLNCLGIIDCSRE